MEKYIKIDLNEDGTYSLKYKETDRIDYKLLSREIGNIFELVRLPKGIDLFIDEEGMYHYEEEQTSLIIKGGAGMMDIRGPLMFVGHKHEETVGLSEEQIEWLTRRLKPLKHPEIGTVFLLIAEGIEELEEIQQSVKSSLNKAKADFIGVLGTIDDLLSNDNNFSNFVHENGGMQFLSNFGKLSEALTEIEEILKLSDDEIFESDIVKTIENGYELIDELGGWFENFEDLMNSSSDFVS